jgi:Flp pilus assembly pilin Flp
MTSEGAGGSSPDRDDGATAVEYALIASLIAAVIAATVALVGEELLALFESVQWW